MSDNKNNTENHKSVKDLFENFEVQPGQHVWDNIINSVHSINAAKIKRNKIITTAATIAVAASAVVIMIFNNYYAQDSTSTPSYTVSTTSPTTTNNKNSLEPITATDSTVNNKNTAKDNNNTTHPNNIIQQTDEHNLPTTPANNTHSNTTTNNTPMPISEMETTNADTYTPETNNNNNTHYTEPEKTMTNLDTTETNIDKTKTNINADNNTTTIDANTAKPNDPYINKPNNSNSDKEGVIYVPSAFTPDQTENNRFFVKGKNIKDYEIRIMSKSKVLVYSSTDINEQWDGTHNGEALDRGVYIYMIVFTDLNNKVHHKNGTLTLIRQN